jgi:hypothetical protein
MARDSKGVKVSSEKMSAPMPALDVGLSAGRFDTVLSDRPGPLVTTLIADWSLNNPEQARA